MKVYVLIACSEHTGEGHQLTTDRIQQVVSSLEVAQKWDKQCSSNHVSGGVTTITTYRHESLMYDDPPFLESIEALSPAKLLMMGTDGSGRKKPASRA